MTETQAHCCENTSQNQGSYEQSVIVHFCPAILKLV